MAKVAVITTCYNALPILKQCLEALFQKSSPDVHAILVDNHSPDSQSREFLKHLSSGAVKVTVLDPGRNVGTHNGWNVGFENGVLGKGFDVVVKLDDDTVITTQDWDKLMVAGLQARPDLAFLSADGTVEAKQLDKWDVHSLATKDCGDMPVFVYEIPPRNIVDFHCVMFRVPDMMRWERAAFARGAGGYTGRVWLTNPEGDGDKRLYGGEELYMARKARAEGKKIAYFRNVFCNHLDQKDRCQDYQLWKFCYGIMRSTDKPVDEWRASGEMLRDMRILVGQWALGQEGWAKQYIVECVRRIGDIGEERDGGALLLLAHGQTGIANYTPRTDMPEVILACDEAAKKLQEKFKSQAKKG